MLCGVIKSSSCLQMQKQIQQALPYADLLELRLDYLDKIDEKELKQILTSTQIPVIFTLRDSTQGGSYKGTKAERLGDIKRLAKLGPAYFDLECHLPIEEVETLTKKHPKIKWIISYHNFKETPQDLELIYRDMQKLPGDFYKIAAYSHSTLDAMKLLSFVKHHNLDGKIIAMSMGPEEQSTRVLAPVFNIPITYGSLEEELKTAPGQIPLSKYVETYSLSTLNPATQLYGLIGYPVLHSPSDHTHNTFLRANNLNAVYIKLPVKPFELKSWFELAKDLRFRGVSVTMPLKESVMEFVDILDPCAKEIGAVNTLLFDKGSVHGFNTDGHGALNAVEEVLPVKGKRIVLVGAGGAAKAIAYEGKKRGAQVVILNRNSEKADELAKRLGCQGGGLNELSRCYTEGYDILINCTPIPMPIEPAFILPGSIVMTIITKPIDSPLLKEAAEKGCRVIYGYKMFIEQALLQFSIWFKDQFDMNEARKLLEKTILEM